MLRRPIVLVAILLTTAGGVSAATSAQDAAPHAAAPPEPHLVLGNDACVKCHADEVKVWQKTPHARTFDELHRRPEAKKIAAKLGIRSIKHEGRCVACHYTQQQTPDAPADLRGRDALAQETVHAIAGVSCESCHGAAKNWLEVHHDYGGEGVTRRTESPEHREKRIARSVAAGMRNPRNVYAIAQACYRCHTTADEELVNVGGHTPGSLDFEFVSWSQGSIRHNFVRTDGESNEQSSPERRRVMFVAGMIADLEASLRATASATTKATYGVTSAKRAARAAARLQSVSKKVDVPRVAEILAVFDSVSLKLNNAAELTDAADRIAKLGYQFAERRDGTSLAALDPFIPARNRWK